MFDAGERWREAQETSMMKRGQVFWSFEPCTRPFHDEMPSSLPDLVTNGPGSGENNLLTICGVGRQEARYLGKLGTWLPACMPMG